MKNSRRNRALAALVSLSLAASAAQAGSDLCENAARQAAAEAGVPADVLLAIALTETGRMRGGTVRPWPWAVNLDGRGHWFDSPAQALALAESALAAGHTGFDLGCFQINWHWHGAHFTSPRALLDPLSGARYAAAFLADLARELGSWERAAGAYHSRRPDLAARYRARFEAHRAGLAGRLPGMSPRPPQPPPS
ncbi:MAG TPA: lytic transglycosylase domain-containing protein, partial [Paracoccus sp.]|nr:lytic transglycosylase domain-containing protein [Paracoccus sp. (in: a-proteobacteria)]